MHSDQIVRRSERAVFRELAGEKGSVLLNLDSGAYHSLNAVGTLIWNLIGDGSTFGDLVDGVRSALTDAPAGLHGEVDSFVQDLLQRDLLTVPEE